MKKSVEARSSPNKLERARRVTAALMATILSGIFLANDQIQPEVIAMTDISTQPLNKDNVSVVTANVHSWKGRSGTNLDNFVTMLRDTKPDIVCGQEATINNGELNRFAQMGYNVLFAATKNNMFYGRFGNFILSRYAIELIDVVKLPNDDYVSSPRNALIAEILTPTGTRSIVTTHLSIHGIESSQQLSFLQATIPKPDILCGDLNQTPPQLGRANLKGTYADVGIVEPINTFPEWKPRIQIDHIASERGYDDPAPRTIAIDSDHLAVERLVAISGVGSFSK